MPAAKHFDPVLGIDIHIIQPPGPVPPVPIPHPFVGMIIDPMDYVPILGATVMVNGVPRAQAGSAGEAIPKHIPIGGTFIKPPANECEMFMGSMTVAADGDAFSYLALPVLSCHDVGMITPPRPKKKSKKKIKSMVLPTTVVLPIPAGPPVLVGGPPTISLMALGMRVGMAGLGKAFKKFKKKFKKWRKKKGKGKKPKKGKSPDNAPCGTDAHPVDVVTGACVDTMVDFRSPHGPLFRWVRHYDSSEAGRPGLVGRGFRHEYERTLEIDQDIVRYTGPTGGEVEFPPFPEGANAVTSDGYVLRRIDDAHYQVIEFRKGAMLFRFRTPGSPALLVRMDSSRDSLVFAHDTAGRISQITDNRSYRFRLDYDRAGRVERLSRLTESTQGDRASTIVAYEYDVNGCLVKGFDALGHSFTYRYDSANRLTKLTDRNRYSFTYEFDAAGRCIRTSGEDGLWGAAFEYEPDARITRVKYADGGMWTKEYNENGIVIAVTDPFGGVLTRSVDENGRVVSEKDPAGRVTEFLYNPSGAHTGRRDPFGHFALPYSEEPFPDDPLVPRVPTTAVEWEWGTILNPAHCVSDAIPRSETAPFPPEILRDLVTSEITSLHRRSNLPPRFSFDKLGRMVEETGGGTGGQSWSYDPEGRLTEHRNRNGAVRQFRNSSWNLLAEETNPLGHKIAYTYTIRGEPRTVQDAGGTVTELQRDTKERITSVTRHGVVREHYRWDNADNLVEKLDGAGQPLLKFDLARNGLVSARHLASGEAHQFKHDGNGRVVLAANGPDKTTFSYDKAGRRLEDKRNGRGVTHKFVNRQLAETMMLGRFSVRYHRPDSRSLVITDPLGGEHRFAWSPRGLIFRRLSSGTEELARYGKDGRCLGKVTKHHASRKKFWRRTYRYSAERELVEVHDNQTGVATFVYDAAGRIIEESPPNGQRHAIQYDAAGNILRKSGLADVTVASGNRLQTAGGDSITYNARQHVAGIQGASGEATFDYDSRDMLVAARTRKGDWRAVYDPLGRRVAKESAAGRSEYFWDQDRLAAEVFPDGRCRVYVYADENALVPFLFIDYENDKASPKKGERYFILANQIGAPVRIENDAGQFVWSATYDAYGQVTVDPASTIDFALRFPGHYHDSETGLHYNRNRYYSPKLGRYLQADPIGLAGGLNVYAYPANPLVQVDVNGLSCDGATNKAKGEAEGGPKRTTAKKGEDVGKIADNVGMEKNHLENLSKRSQTNGEIIIVRASNPASMPHHGKPGHVPKGVDCKLKTAKPPDPHAGLVKKPDPMSPDDAKHVKELEDKGWKFDDDGVAHDPNGNKVYGDHDLQGAYHKDEFSGTTSKVNTNDPNYQKGLNDDVCPENPMFQHGANDNFKKPDPNNPGKTKMGRTPEPDEKYVVTKPDGSVTEINGTDELKKFYDEEGIPWPY